MTRRAAVPTLQVPAAQVQVVAAENHLPESYDFFFLCVDKVNVRHCTMGNEIPKYRSFYNKFFCSAKDFDISFATGPISIFFRGEKK